MRTILVAVLAAVVLAACGNNPRKTRHVRSPKRRGRGALFPRSETLRNLHGHRERSERGCRDLFCRADRSRRHEFSDNRHHAAGKCGIGREIRNCVVVDFAGQASGRPRNRERPHAIRLCQRTDKSRQIQGGTENGNRKTTRGITLWNICRTCSTARPFPWLRRFCWGF